MYPFSNIASIYLYYISMDLVGTRTTIYWLSPTLIQVNSQKIHSSFTIRIKYGLDTSPVSMAWMKLPCSEFSHAPTVLLHCVAGSQCIFQYPSQSLANTFAVLAVQKHMSWHLAFRKIIISQHNYNSCQSPS